MAARAKPRLSGFWTRRSARNLWAASLSLPSLEEIYRSFGMPLYLPSAAWNVAVPVYADGRQIGKATSGMWSPILKKYIALARLEPQFARRGSQVALEVTVEAHRRQAEAIVVETPFFDPDRKRA